MAATLPAKVEISVQMAMALVRGAKKSEERELDAEASTVIRRALLHLGGFRSTSELRAATDSPAYFAYCLLNEVRFGETPEYRTRSLKSLERQIITCMSWALGQ